MKMRSYFFLNIKHGASELYLVGASNSLAPALTICQPDLGLYSGVKYRHMSLKYKVLIINKHIQTGPQPTPAAVMTTNFFNVSTKVRRP